MANNSPNTTIPFTLENKKTLYDMVGKVHRLIDMIGTLTTALGNENETRERVSRLYDMVGTLTTALRDDRETREQALNDMSKKIDKFEKYIMVDYAKNIKSIRERLDELENRYDDLKRDSNPEKKLPGAGKRRRKTKKSAKTSKCKQYLKSKIKKTMREYKKKRKGVKSRKQALAIAYSQTKKKYPRCKLVKK